MQMIRGIRKWTEHMQRLCSNKKKKEGERGTIAGTDKIYAMLPVGPHSNTIYWSRSSAGVHIGDVVKSEKITHEYYSNAMYSIEICI